MTDLPDPSPEGDVARLDALAAELESVDVTLRRLDDESYGRCELCGAAIDETQLAADPLSRRCAGHPLPGQI